MQQFGSQEWRVNRVLRVKARRFGDVNSTGRMSARQSFG